MSDTRILNALADEWARRNGLRRDERYFGEQSIYPLFSKNDRRWEEVEEFHFGDSLFAHSRAFKAPGAARASVFVAAPYVAQLARHVGTPLEIHEHIWAIADGLNLRARVGHDDDRIYEVSSGEATLPIVWWKPSAPLLYPGVDSDPASQATRVEYCAWTGLKAPVQSRS